MIILSWNIRGLNSPSKIQGVRRLIRVHKVDMIALFETSVKIKNIDKLVGRLGKEWSWYHNYSHSMKGRF